MTGFVYIDKPEGITSFGAVAKCRWLFGTKKVGHTGTLDPMATGVLVVAVGGCTRFIELIPSHRKSYRAGIKFGIRTDTLDTTGEITDSAEYKFTKEEFESALMSFLGRSRQKPPMFSAKKIDGKKLYQLAREGREVEREDCEIEIFSASVVSFDDDSAVIDISCSGGTYIRSLIDDLGVKLGTFFAMSSLRRTEANGVEIAQCHSFEELEQMKEDGTISSVLQKTDSVISYAHITVSEPQSKRFRNGGELSLDRVRQIKTDGLYNVYSSSGEFLGVGQADFSANELKVKRVYCPDT